jgi:acetate kinase
MSRDILAINTGSSSLKAALFRIGPGEERVLTASAERIGLSGGRLRVTDAGSKVLLDDTTDLATHEAAVERLLAWLKGDQQVQLAGVGHRIVHGGPNYTQPALVTDKMLADIERLIPIDPEHLPQALAAIRAVRQAYPTLPQVACFDTAFHRTMPRVAQLYPLPRAWTDAGVLRYGFHGLSYEYIAQELTKVEPDLARGRVVIAHLGNGASLAALTGGVSVDTTMGFSPTGGLMMGTRTGDLDPGVLLYLLQERGVGPDALNDLVNRQSGLLGVSGISSDARDLLERASSNADAAEAIALFSYQARKFLGAFVAVLGGLDLLVFTAGIGEHAAPIRAAICSGFDYVGLALDETRNASNAPIISRDHSRVKARVMKTDEELMIARHAAQIVGQ